MAADLEIVVDRAGKRRTYRSPAGVVAVDGLVVTPSEVRVEGIDGRGRRVAAAASPVAASGELQADPFLASEPFQDMRVRADGGDWVWVRADELGRAKLEPVVRSVEARCATADGVLRGAVVRLRQ